ncbi:MAG: hypothetical protein MK102_17420 [Fuerstiella sp.]|nr:hypothetical protein [Fuerstiella sp.]
MFQFLRTLLAGNRPSVAGRTSAIVQFQRFENDLRQDFFALASQSGKPRGLRWITCDWLQELMIVADSKTQLISAFASVNLGFEAIEGSDMEDVAAVSTIRDGSAVFHFQDSDWGSAGRVIFNMNPVQAAGHLIPDAETLFHRRAR